MKFAKVLRLLLLAACLVLAVPVILHWDAYQLADRPGVFTDPSSGAFFKESVLETEFFRFLGVASVTVIVYAVRWIRAGRFAL